MIVGADGLCNEFRNHHAYACQAFPSPFLPLLWTVSDPSFPTQHETSNFCIRLCDPCTKHNVRVISPIPHLASSFQFRNVLLTESVIARLRLWRNNDSISEDATDARSEQCEGA